MNFKEAYKAMQEGKKVRIKTENGYFYYRKNMKRIYHHISEKCFDLPTEEIAIENALAEDWEVIKEKKKYWIPEEEEEYFTISNRGYIAHCINKNIEIAQAQSEIGNCFKTEEEAEHMLEKIKVIHELKKFAYDNNSEEFLQKWQLDDYDKYFIVYNYDKEQIEIDSTLQWRSVPFNVYFETKELAQQAINTIGKDRIKKYYFDVEE